MSDMGFSTWYNLFILTVMMRILLAIGIFLAGIWALVPSFFHSASTDDWAERLKSPQTFTIIATSTVPIALEPQVAFGTPNGSGATGSPTVAPQKTNPTPPPVRSQPKKLLPKQASLSGPSTEGNINEKMIIDLTNVERVREGRTSLLAWNEKLSLMAYQKAQDMLTRQYFAHESPDGKSVSDLAGGVGYLYRLVGENLAVGNFHTNEELIKGWMESPGHRENMLKEGYTEMGAAAIEGVYEGDRVWMAVQEFGKPFPDCEKPDPIVKAEIAQLNAELSALDEGIALARAVVETTPDETIRTQKISDYNTLVEVYNSLVPKLKTLINSYNASVRAYNACLET